MLVCIFLYVKFLTSLLQRVTKISLSYISWQAMDKSITANLITAYSLGLTLFFAGFFI
jgi:hypothetical protein